jgi:predicted PhzF superfamily epimerase YddE/YHI9
VKVKQVDVFTDEPFLGNPVAVVVGGEGLDAQAMQRIACWTNLSETTFLLKSSKADDRLRIFTPRQELPFAGHPTIGSASGNLSVGVFLRENGLVERSGAAYVARQGMQLGRDGRVSVRVSSKQIEIGGHAVTCVEGTLRI